MLTGLVHRAHILVINVLSLLALLVQKYKEPSACQYLYFCTSKTSALIFGVQAAHMLVINMLSLLVQLLKKYKY